MEVEEEVIVEEEEEVMVVEEVIVEEEEVIVEEEVEGVVTHINRVENRARAGGTIVNLVSIGV